MSKIYFSKDFNFKKKSFSINFDLADSFTIDEINEIALCYGRDKIKNINEYFEKFLSYFSDVNSINHQLILSVKMKSEYLNYLKCQIYEIAYLLLPYFKNIYSIRSSLLSKTTSLLIGEENLKIPIYSHDTKTGRSRIISGANYMTMKKEKRKLLKHKDLNREVFEIDFSSCEPIFYFNFVKENIKTDDLYNLVKNDLNIKENRKSVKNAIISILYGAGYDTVKRISNINKESYYKIKDYMLIEEFHKKVKIKNKMIKNYYGRPIFINSEKNKINYWVQSSVADYVYLSFHKFSKNFKSFEFHAIIHDAMIFSIKKSEIDKIKNINAIDEDITNYKIPVKIERISDN